MASTLLLHFQRTIPIARTPLVGRSRERSEIAALLARDDVPLVTLTGPGGVGKTRLAIQAAQDLLSHFEGNVAFVELASLRDPHLVLPAIAQAFGLVALGDQPSARLHHFLDQRAFLLVIDNFEQVIESAVEIAELLTRCAALTILVTSREPLRIAGEHQYPIGTLSLPMSTSSEDVRQSAAVELFLQRAVAVSPDFALSPEITETIADICIRLDGLPLALELAASRVKLLSPNAIQERLVDRMTLLRRDGRDVPSRLRTMRDAVGWSYDLLSQDERFLFRLLAVFPGGCTLESASWVARALEINTPADLLDDIGSLVEKSLLVPVERPSAEPRFRILETVRAYGLEQLEAHGELPPARDAMASWMIHRTGNAFEEQWGPEQDAWSRFFDGEIDNLRASLEWLLTTMDLNGASQLMVAASRYWHIRGNFSEANSWAQRVMDLDKKGGQESLRARVELASGWHMFHLGDLNGARRETYASLHHAIESNDRWTEANARHVLGALHASLGEYEAAIPLFEQVLAYYRETNDALWQAQALNSLGHANFLQGSVDLAEQQLQEAMAILQKNANTYSAGMVLVNLARIARHRKDYARARALLEVNLEQRWHHGDMLGLMSCMRNLGRTLALIGENEEAARLLAAADQIRVTIGAGFPQHMERYNQTLARLQLTLGEEHFRTLWEEGRTTALDVVVRQTIAPSRNAGDRSAIRRRSTQVNELTAREREVLQLVCAGSSNRDISETLFISERTAQTHVQHILAKLEVNSRLAAAARAAELGLI